MAKINGIIRIFNNKITASRWVKRQLKNGLIVGQDRSLFYSASTKKQVLRLHRSTFKRHGIPTPVYLVSSIKDVRTTRDFAHDRPEIL